MSEGDTSAVFTTVVERSFDALVPVAFGLERAADEDDVIKSRG